MYVHVPSSQLSGFLGESKAFEEGFGETFSPVHF